MDDQIEGVIASSWLKDWIPSDPCEECIRNKFPPAYRLMFKLAAARPGGLEAFDRLLNGAYGLRARYAAGASCGQQANRRVCRALREAIASSRIEGAVALSAVDRERAARSLNGTSAKVWYDIETDRVSADPASGSVTCDRWARSAADVERTLSELDGTMGPQDIEFRLLKGFTVPQPKGLDVKGAFVRADGTEYIALGKKLRSRQIHLLGWT